MIDDPNRFKLAIAAFDRLNAEDPNHELVNGKEHPKELLYSERMTAMLMRYATEASETLQLAARCQHIQRWKIARSSYPMTKPGYHQWRIALRDFHAKTAQMVLQEAGYDEHMITRVCALIRKEGLTTNPETQILEDVIVLVFLESYLADFVATHSSYDEAKFMEILRKTLGKISSKGRLATVTMINPPDALASLLRQLANQTGSLA